MHSKLHSSTLPNDLAFALRTNHPFRLLSSDRIICQRSEKNKIRSVRVIRKTWQVQVYPIFRRTVRIGARKYIVSLPTSLYELRQGRNLVARQHPCRTTPAGSYLVVKTRTGIVACAVVAMLTYTTPPFRNTFLQYRYRSRARQPLARATFAWARRFVVARGWRRRGIGAALARTVALFVGRSWLPKCVAVETYTSKAEPFLEKAGYKLVGHSARSGKLYYARHVAGIRADDPCPCGSGKKYKKCHGAAA